MIFSRYAVRNLLHSTIPLSPHPNHLPSPKSHRVISFADPHPLIPLESYRFKNRVGGPPRLAYSAVPLISLDATLLNHLVCIEDKRLTEKCCEVKPFRCNTYQKGGYLLSIQRAFIPPRRSRTLRDFNASTFRPSDVRTFRRSLPVRGTIHPPHLACAGSFRIGGCHE